MCLESEVMIHGAVEYDPCCCRKEPLKGEQVKVKEVNHTRQPPFITLNGSELRASLRLSLCLATDSS